MTGIRGTFVISWSQTELDGLAGAPVGALEVGATWRWTGDPTRVDGPNDVLVLNGPEGEADLRRRAARTVRRLLGDAMPHRPTLVDPWDDPVFDRFFAVTDGRSRYAITLIEMEQTARPLLLFLNRVPPPDTDLWITSTMEDRKPANRVHAPAPDVICFTRGTLLRTPQGPRKVEDLAEGDLIETRDNGAQRIQWIGNRRMSGARLFAMPELRPIRIRGGALGDGVPQGDLVVSPMHRLLVRGRMAQALFGTDEVLVAARDMLNDGAVRVDRTLREVEYFHILLPSHNVVWANGVATESFHPAQTSMSALKPEQRDRLLGCRPELQHGAHRYGAPVRRMLTRSEAAILLADAGRRH